MKKLTGWLQWLDKNILKLLVVGFIIIIPLLFKIPVDNVEYTYIHYRYEDLYVALIALIYGIQFLRGKVKLPPKKYVWVIGLFWASMFASFAWGYWIQNTIDFKNLGILFALRRIEYMIIFFVAFSTIRSKQDFFFYFRFIFGVLAIVALYGIGQKFLGWPAVQTMNPEYSKGYWLTLAAFSRVSSTFGGHYDLAAYLIFLMPVVIGFFIKSGKKMYYGIFVLSLITLILTASRASYFSFLGAIILYLLYIRKFKLLAVVLITTAVLTPLSGTLTKRLTRTFQQSKIFVDPQTGAVIVPKNSTDPSDLPPGDFGAGRGIDKNKLPKKSASDEPVDAETEEQAKRQIRESILNEASKSGTTLSSEEIEAMVNELFGEKVAITKYLVDISLSTRFQVEWPRAINAVTESPVLGTGPSSLGEATDNNFLRWLGEFGILGTTLLLAVFGMIIRDVFRKIKEMPKDLSYVYFGFLFGFLSLLVNATYIDVFDASKVAYTFWLVAAIFVASLPFVSKDSKKETAKS